ncbi:MAG: pyridoxamine 5'-phosphate oxidase family protein [Burkholderiales bacterium]|nr:pyridoxamine 5'-phosphate oxidase family protein [Burkholderiales bacterium]
MPEASRERALAYLRAHHVMTLATHGAGVPWAAAVFYANDGFDLIFLSSPSSRHCGNLAANPRAAATIQEDYADWTEIKGVQMEGTVTELGGETERAARSLYGARFPFVRQAVPALAEALKKIRWYRLAPERLYYIDNSRGFGHRDEIAPG